MQLKSVAKLETAQRINQQVPMHICSLSRVDENNNFCGEHLCSRRKHSYGRDKKAAGITTTM